MGFILMLIVGGLIGWLAGVILGKDIPGGIVGNIIAGLIGSAIGGSLLGDIGPVWGWSRNLPCTNWFNYSNISSPFLFILKL